MAFDIPKWLKEDMAFSDEEIATLAPKFAAKAEVLEKGQLRLQDYSRHMTGLQKSQADLAAANERLNAEMAEWATLTAAEKQQATALRGDLEKSQAEILKLTQTINRVAADAGLDPAKILAGANVTPVEPKPVVQPFDTSKFVDRDQFGSVANALLMAGPELMAIQHEHQQLTGEWLDTRAIVKELQARASQKGNQKPLDVRAIWEETHAVPEKRTAVEKKKFDDAIASAEQRGRDAALSEATIPGQTPSGRGHGPLTRNLHLESHKPVAPRPQPTGMSPAMLALRTGKYRVEQNRPA